VYYLSLQTQIFLKVSYPNSRSLITYKRIKKFGEQILRSLKFKRARSIVKSVISVVRPSGNVSVLANPAIEVIGSKPQQLTIMSANLWHDWPRNRGLKDRLECFVELIKDEEVDILLLQELIRTDEFEADKWLGEKLGMAYIYSRSNGNAQEIGFEEGLAIYSRFPIKDHRLAQLSDQNNPFSRRMALGTRIETTGRDFFAFSVHLGILNKQNERQFSRLRNWVEQESGDIPAVIGGDFNTQEGSKQIQSAASEWHDSYRSLNPHDNGYSHELRWPWGTVLRRARLDYLFLRKGNYSWRVDEARHVDEQICPLSDHKPVLIKTSFVPIGI
jgi:endonuclease/exonuclease/phosphatase family metal-dependent hydrolase